MILFYILLLYSFINASLFIFYPIHYLDFFASIIAFIFCNFFKSHKRYQIAKYNLIKVFPNENQQFIKNNIYLSTKICILNLLVGLFGILIYHSTYAEEYIQINIPEKLKNQEKSRGILLLSCHYGLFYIFIIFFGKISNINNYHIHHKQKNINNFLYNKSYKNTYYIKTNNTIYNVLNIKKKIVNILCDHKYKKNKNEINFLNNKYKFQISPYYIYKKTNRKIWLGYVDYNTINKKVIVSFEELKNIDDLNQNQITQKIADHFSEKIINNPDQYFWMYNLFNYYY